MGINYSVKEHKRKVVVSTKIGIGLNNFSVQLAMADNTKEAMMMALRVIDDAMRRFAIVGKEIAGDIGKIHGGSEQTVNTKMPAK
jgi:hypothetical protein